MSLDSTNDHNTRAGPGFVPSKNKTTEFPISKSINPQKAFSTRRKTEEKVAENRSLSCFKLSTYGKDHPLPLLLLNTTDDCLQIVTYSTSSSYRSYFRDYYKLHARHILLNTQLSRLLLLHYAVKSLWNRLDMPQDTNYQERNTPSAPLRSTVDYGCAQEENNTTTE